MAVGEGITGFAGVSDEHDESDEEPAQLSPPTSALSTREISTAHDEDTSQWK